MIHSCAFESAAFFPRVALDLTIERHACVDSVTSCSQPCFEATPELMIFFYDLLCILWSYIGLDGNEITRDGQF